MEPIEFYGDLLADLSPLGAQANSIHSVCRDMTCLNHCHFLKCQGASITFLFEKKQRQDRLVIYSDLELAFNNSS